MDSFVHARYSEVLYNLLHNPQTEPLIKKAMSSYELYEPKEHDTDWQPHYIPTREELNTAILNYYMFREIGFETVGRFCFELEVALKEIMPRYNLLFYSADQDYNIIYNVDYKRTIDTDREGTSEGETEGTETTTGTGNASERTTSESTGTTTGTSETNTEDQTSTTQTAQRSSKDVKSLTPQNELNISNTNIDTVSYADEAGWEKSNDSGTGTSSGTGTTTGETESTSEQSGTGTLTRNESTSGSAKTSGSSTGHTTGKEKTLETTFGNYGVVSAQDLILKYRETIINIVQMIINDPRIAELFMLIY